MTDNLPRSLRLAIVFCLVAHFLADGLAVCLASPASAASPRVVCLARAASGRLAAGEPHGDTAAPQAGALEAPGAPDQQVAGPRLMSRAGHLPAAFHPPQPRLPI